MTDRLRSEGKGPILPPLCTAHIITHYERKKRTKKFQEVPYETSDMVFDCPHVKTTFLIALVRRQFKKVVTVQMNMWTSSKEVPQVWEKGREEKSRLAGDNLPGNRSAIKCKSPLRPLRSAKEEDINAPRRLPLISDQRLGGNHGACTYQILEV